MNEPGSESPAVMEQADLRLEIEGDNVTPETVDARAVLELAAAYFDLLVRVAKERGRAVELTGLSVVSKCIALATTPSSIADARDAAADAQDYIAGLEEAWGVTTAVNRFRRARRLLPPGHRAQIIVGLWKRELPRDAEAVRLPPYASVMLRATPVKVGGQKPRVRFSSDSEEDEFSLEVTEEQARELGAHLYEEVDIAATVYRDENDSIRGGRLDEVNVLPSPEGDARAAMRAWLRENAPQWDGIDDVDAELGRG